MNYSVITFLSLASAKGLIHLYYFFAGVFWAKFFYQNFLSIIFFLVCFITLFVAFLLR